LLVELVTEPKSGEDEPIPDILRGLHWSALADLSNAIQEAVTEETQNLRVGGDSQQN
jgi:hypothetical protein